MGSNFLTLKGWHSPIFRDETKLYLEYVPKDLPHREDTMKKLTYLFWPIISSTGNFSASAWIHGAVGTGKTAVSKKFGFLFEKISKQKSFLLKYIHINCKQKRTGSNVILSILDNLNVTVPSRGLSFQELASILKKILFKKKRYILLVLDEAGYLLKKEGSDIIYSLARLTEEEFNQRPLFSFIFTSKQGRDAFLLDQSTRSSLAPTKIHLPKYNKNELKDILTLRTEEALRKGVIKEEVIDLIAEIASSKGDARYAIELLWKAGKEAEMEDSKEILPSHVHKVNLSIMEPRQYEEINNLPRHEKMVLLAIIKENLSGERKYTRIKRIVERYRGICRKYGEEPRSYTRVWQFIKDLQHAGLIEVNRLSEGERGTLKIRVTHEELNSLEGVIKGQLC